MKDILQLVILGFCMPFIITVLCFMFILRVIGHIELLAKLADLFEGLHQKIISPTCKEDEDDASVFNAVMFSYSLVAWVCIFWGQWTFYKEFIA